MWKTTMLLALFFLATTPGCGAPQLKPAEVAAPTPATRATYPKIVLYSVTWCPHCTEAKEYLTKKNIPYENRDVERDDQARDTLLNKYETNVVPLIVIGNDEAVLRGFNPEMFERALGNLKSP